MSIFARSIGGLFFVAGIVGLIMGLNMMSANEIRLLELRSTFGELKGVLFILGSVFAVFFGASLLLGASIFDQVKRLADINASAATQLSAQNSMLAEASQMSAYLPSLPTTQSAADEPR